MSSLQFAKPKDAKPMSEQAVQLRSRNQRIAKLTAKLRTAEEAAAEALAARPEGSDTSTVAEMDADRAVRKLREQIADINAREQDRKERAAAEAEEKKMRETPAMALLLIFVTEHPGGPALAITGERYKLRADGSALHTDSSGAWHVDPQPKDPTTLAVRLREFWESYVKQIEADFYRLKETAVGKSFQSTDVSRWFPRHVDFDTIEGLIHGLADVARKGRLAYQAVTEICEHIPGSRDPRLIRQEREDEIMRAHRERNAAANAIARIQI